jgi:FlaA1/EpsC-like NDP-sugar epimerase
MPANNRQKVLVVGAGDAGSMIVRELRKNPQVGLYPIGFVDDDDLKINMQIYSIPVLGNRQQIPELVRQNNIAQVIIAMPTAPGEVIREVVRLCENVGVKTKIIPAMSELLTDEVSLHHLRDVEIEDLLRRDPVQTDIGAVYDLLYGQRVLVTGSGGSIGSELCRQIIRCAPSQLILIGHGENSIFDIYHELLKRPEQGTQIIPIIADVRFAHRIQSIFEQYMPDVVFHAAAHKHVPLMEMNPTEAITNNIEGTRNVLEAALATKVAHFVMISTDKAVNPTNVMGASKRTAELLVHQAARKSGRPYVAVRFGNVLGSRGSVVLTFKKQIEQGGPVTITHPNVERFFMTIPEAVQLVLQAAVLGKGGEVFVLDMGQPLKILDLAQDLIRLSGLEVGRDIQIEFVGLRPGEKLTEELFVEGERYQRTPHQKIYLATNASTLVPAQLDELVDYLIHNAQRQDQAAVLAGLRNLVPEYQPLLDKPESEHIRKGLSSRTKIISTPQPAPIH